MTAPPRRRSKDGDLTLPFANLPTHELRRKARPGGKYSLEVWQLHSPATPRLDGPEIVASLAGAPLRLLETRVSKRLTRAGINVAAVHRESVRSWTLDEDQALALGLLFRALAPMRNPDRILRVADGIDAMSREEAGYWLGMAVHRKNPRRVLAALRLLLDSL